MDGYIAAEGYVDVESNDVNVDISLVINGANTDYFENISIYPNPSHGEIFVNYANDYSVQIIDQKGAVIYNGYIENNKSTIDLQDKPAGLYNIIFTSGNQVFSRKMLIVK